MNTPPALYEASIVNPGILFLKACFEGMQKNVAIVAKNDRMATIRLLS